MMHIVRKHWIILVLFIWHLNNFGCCKETENNFFPFFLAESFETHYGEGGRDGDGDVFKESNIKAFAKFVLEGTDGKGKKVFRLNFFNRLIWFNFEIERIYLFVPGVHFMMADGGFSVEGQENIQEILSKQLYLCQFLVAMSIVRNGGHFVCKLFDLFTPFR